MNEPLVTCLCLTMRGRSEFLKRAAECFNRQTYRRRELLIVADSILDTEGVDLNRAEVVSIMPPRWFVPLRKLNIGQKRNLGCESAVGSDLIAIWDDDDFSAPGRLAAQVLELDITRKAVTGYSAMKFTDGSNWWRFRIGEGFAIGSSLMFRRDWWETHRFDELQVGEDAGFCERAFEANQLATVPDLNQMYATIHSGNTSPRKPEGPGWSTLQGFVWK